MWSVLRCETSNGSMVRNEIHGLVPLRNCPDSAKPKRVAGDPAHHRIGRTVGLLKKCVYLRPVWVRIGSADW